MIRYAPWLGWRTLTRVSRQPNASHTSTGFGAYPQFSILSETSITNVDVSTQDVLMKSSKSHLNQAKSSKDKKNTIVAAAFANLKGDDGKKVHRKHPLPLDDCIRNADTVETLLSVADTPTLTRHNAFSVVSTLGSWTRGNRIKLSDFESDPRFIKLCGLLGRGAPYKAQSTEHFPTTSGFGDLAMVLGVTGDDEAAKLVAGISVNQMIKVMSALATKRRRSTPLLRSLAFNIGCSDEVLSLKQGADVLYAMGILNFPDDTLLERTCSNICIDLPENTKSSVVGSVLTSIGHLRYRHTALLDGLSEWVVQNIANCRQQDIIALLMTLAVLSYVPNNADQLFNIVTDQVTASEISFPLAWLDVVWSLVVLDRAKPVHVQSVLASQFQEKLVTNTSDSNGISVSTKRKLLNINAAGQLLVRDYGGPFLKLDTFGNVPMNRSREKQAFLSVLLDTLSNLLPSTTYLKTDIDTGMGFMLDGECIIDSKFNPLPLSENSSASKGKRIGILALNYGDMCRASRPLPSGQVDLAVRLLQAKGYKVLVVPFTEFNPRDKLVVRVQYLEQQLKLLVKER